MKIDYPLNFVKTGNIIETGKLLDSFLPSEKSYIVISGPTKSNLISLDILKSVKNKPKASFKININSHNKIDSIQYEISKLNVHYIVSIGGGVATDFAKRLAYLCNVDLISVPTTVSNDGMASPIAVISDNNRKKSLIGKMPDIIIVPIEIIKEAPLKFIKAAILDALSNISAINDWYYADENINLNTSQSLAINLSKMAASMILNIKNLLLDDERVLDTILDVQLLSGMAMTIAGSSRPCSGSEHIISHALDELGIADELLHGEKVGSISEFTLFMQGKSNKNVSRLLRNLGIKKGIPGLENMTKDEIIKVFRLSKILRPERKNILDKYDEQELYNKYINFLGE